METICRKGYEKRLRKCGLYLWMRWSNWTNYTSNFLRCETRGDVISLHERIYHLNVVKEASVWRKMNPWSTSGWWKFRTKVVYGFVPVTITTYYAKKRWRSCWWRNCVCRNSFWPRSIFSLHTSTFLIMGQRMMGIKHKHCEIPMNDHVNEYV